ncbi:MAG: hypothetical protein KGJ02_03400 [Verrucomicrobiota bacterium]|nr:hypothetical protein [Verrucomicrobiota bacterium]
MSNQNFYSFDSKLLSSTFQAYAIELDNVPGEGIADHHRLILGEYEEIHFPVIFKHAKGKKLCDILDTGWVSLYLISDRMKSILTQSNLTGWKTFPITLLDEKDQKITGYSGFSVIGRCGEIDYSKCEIIKKQRSPTAPFRKFYKGLYVGIDKWDDSDFFLPKDYFGIIISSKAANVLKKNKITNMKLSNLMDIETSEDIVAMKYRG